MRNHSGGWTRRAALSALALITIAGGCGTRVKTPPASLSAAPVLQDTSTALPPGESSGIVPGGTATTAATGTSTAPQTQVGRPVGTGAGVATGGTRPPGQAATQRPTTQPAAGGSTAKPADPSRSVPGQAPVAPAPAGGPKSDLVVGSVGTLSGVAGDLLKDAVQAVQIWTRSINDRGGLNGHKVRLITADDGADPARHRAIVQDLVENKGVIAFVQNQEGFAGPSAAEYPTQKRIPVINTESSQNYVYDSPMYFPVTPSGDQYHAATIAAIAKVALERGLKKLAIVHCVEVPAACGNAADVYARHGAELGFKMVYRAQASLTQPDYTAECLNARNAGAEVVAVALDTNSLHRLAASCARQGFRPLWGSASIQARASMPDDPNFEGAVVGSHTFAWPARDNPARLEFHETFKRYAPGVEPVGGSANGWVAAKTLEAVAANLPEPPTSKFILEGLWSLNGTDLGGLTYPLRFSRDQLPPKFSCGAVVVAEKGRWAAPFGGAVSCAPKPYA